MVAATKKVEVQLPAFKRGLVRNVSGGDILQPPDALWRAENVLYSDIGQLRRRQRYDHIGNAGFANDDVRALWEIQQTMGNEDQIFAVDETGTLWQLVSGTWTATSLTSTFPNDAAPETWKVAMAPIADGAGNIDLHVSQNGGLTPGTSVSKKWTGSTSTWGAGVVPQAMHLSYHRNRMFAANTAAYQSTVFYSDYLDADTWGASSYIDINPQDGEQIWGMVPFGNDLFIIKNSSCFLLAGASAEDFAVYPVTNSFGTRSPNSVVEIANRILFWDETRGLVAFDGTNFTPLSDPILSWIRSYIDADYLYKIAVWPDREGRIYVSLPIVLTGSTSSRNTWTFVYDPRFNAWTEFNYGANKGVDSTTYEGPLIAGVKQIVLDASHEADAVKSVCQQFVPGTDQYSNDFGDGTVTKSNQGVIVSTWWAPTGLTGRFRVHGVQITGSIIEGPGSAGDAPTIGCTLYWDGDTIGSIGPYTFTAPLDGDYYFTGGGETYGSSPQLYRYRKSSIRANRMRIKLTLNNGVLELNACSFLIGAASDAYTTTGMKEVGS